MSAREAGRELDAEIAERLFGYEWWRSRSTGRRCLYAPGQNPEWMDVRADMTEALVGDWNAGTWTPRYSTDIGAAWLVVERMLALGWWPELRRIEDWDRAEKWWVNFGRPPCTWTAAEVEAPFAICLAALAAIASAPSEDSDP